MTPNIHHTANMDIAASELDKSSAMIYDEMDELVAAANLFKGSLAGGVGFKDSAGNTILVSFQDAERGRILAKVNHRDWTLLQLLDDTEYFTVLDGLRSYMAQQYLKDNDAVFENHLPHDTLDRHFHVRNV